MIGETLDIRHEIEQADKAFCEAFNRGDAEGVGACYAEGGQILPPGGEIVERPAIQAFWQTLMNAGIAQAALKPVEIERCGETAYEVGVYELSLADGTRADRGKYVVIWKLEQLGWKLYRDCFNTSLSAS